MVPLFQRTSLQARQNQRLMLRGGGKDLPGASWVDVKPCCGFRVDVACPNFVPNPRPDQPLFTEEANLHLQMGSPK